MQSVRTYLAESVDSVGKAIAIFAALPAALLGLGSLFGWVDVYDTATFGHTVFRVFTVLPLLAAIAFLAAGSLLNDPGTVLRSGGPLTAGVVLMILVLGPLSLKESPLFLYLSLLCFGLATMRLIAVVTGSGAEEKLDDGDAESGDHLAQQKVLQAQAQANPLGAGGLDYVARASRHTFAQVAGMPELKARLREIAAEVTGGVPGQATRNGVLFFGEPGNGKTFIAEAFAGEMGMPILSINYGTVASKFLNQTTEQVMKVIEDAKRQAPCVLFLDEADSLFTNRDSITRGESEKLDTTNALLAALVDIRHHKVVVVAATNSIDRIDSAASREGRFDFKIEIPAPDAEARQALIELELKKFSPVTLDASAQAQAIKRWEGFSVVRIRSVVEEAARAARKAGGKKLVFADLQLALRTIQGQRAALPEGTPGLADLSLADEQMELLRGVVVRMLNIERLEALGGKVPTGLLFAGPPGTGKTVTARAVARDSGWAFISTCGADLIADPSKIAKIVRDARDLRPCIVFIDEADDVCANRADGSQYVSSVTNKLLTAVDGAAGKAHDVLWIAATNHPENFDPAMLRRFSEKIPFRLPDAPVVARFVARWVEASPALFHASVSAQTVGRRLEGISIAHVEQVLIQAVNRAATRAMITGEDRSVVTMDDIEDGLSLVMG